MDLRISKALGISVAVHFFGVSGIILARSYIDILFLSTYPTHYIPYLFIGQTLVTLFLTLVLTPILAKGSSTVQVALLIGGSLIVTAVTLILPPDFPGLPFGVSLWLSALVTLIGVFSWSAVGDAFDIRTFKKVAKWVGFSGSVGALIAGFAIPVLVQKASPDSILIALSILVLFCAVGLSRLKRRSTKSSRTGPSGQNAPLRYALFRSLAVGVGILLFIDVLTDYILKRELALTFDKEGIAAFMGPFYGLSSVATLVVQFSVTDRLLRRFGPTGLLFAVPVMCLFGAGAVLLFPGLYAGAALRFVEGVGYYGLYSVGREIADTPLPASIRRTAKLFLKGIISPVGTGAASLFLMLVTSDDARFVGGIIAILSAVWIYNIYMTKRAYQSTLAEAVRTKRFGLSFVVPETGWPVSLKEMHRHTIAAQDEDTVIMGLNQLKEEDHQSLPEVALKRLHDPSSRIRSAVADTAHAIGDVDSVPLLLQQFEKETDTQVAWRLLFAVAHLAPEVGIDTALRVIDHTSPRIRGGAVLILLCSADLEGLIVAAPALKEMLCHGSSTMRMAAADIIGGLSGKLQKELAPLLEDKDESVRIAAVRACQPDTPASNISRLASMVGTGSLGRLAGVAMLTMGERGLEHLLDIVFSGTVASKRAAIRIIGHIPSEKSEEVLSSLGENTEFEIANAASEAAARRAHRLGTTNAFRAEGRLHALREVKRVAALLTAESCTLLGNKVRIEVTARRRLAQNQFLHWFAVATSPLQVLEAIPSVLPSISDLSDPDRRAAAVELLDAVATDSHLRDALSTALEVKPASTLEEATRNLKTVADPWLDRLLVVHSGAPQPEGTMDLFDRATLLRKVDLFEALPGEVLLSIAEMAEPMEIFSEDTIFNENDAPSAFYIIASGKVEIQKGTQTIARLKAPQYFGELGLLDNAPRLAAAKVKSDGLLMRIERENFYQITEDLPEVLRGMIRKLIQYVRGTDGGACQ